MQLNAGKSKGMFEISQRESTATGSGHSAGGFILIEPGISMVESDVCQHDSVCVEQHF